MKNTLCKPTFLLLAFLFCSIPHLYAVDNGATDVMLAAGDTSAPHWQKMQSDQNMSAEEIAPQTTSSQDLEAAQRALEEELEKLAKLLPAENNATDDNTIQQMAHEYNQEMLEPLYNMALEQVMRVDVVLEELAANLATNNLIKTKNRAGTVEKIRSLRTPLYVIMNTKMVPLEASSVYAIMMQVQAIAQNITESLRQGIDTLESYDLDEHIPSLQPNNDAAKQLQEALVENQEILETMGQQASMIGLRFYNIAWRALHKHLFDPWQHMHMTEATLGAFYVTVSVTLLWYYLGGETIPGLPASFGKWLRGKLGWPGTTASDALLNDNNGQVLISSSQKTLPNGLIPCIWAGLFGYDTSPAQTYNPYMARPIGTLGRLEDKLAGFLHDKYVIGSAILAPAGVKLFDSIFPQISVLASRTLKEIDRRLMGGACIQHKIETDIVYSYKSPLRLDDMIGCEEQKEVIRRLVTFFKKGPETFQRAGIDLLLKTGILAFGPTRTGKSMFIDVLAGELSEVLGDSADLKLWKISYQMIQEKGIQWVLDNARFYAPCIIVIEEIDLLGLQRTENKQLLAQFMIAMNSCFQDNALEKAVIMVGTTNRLEHMEEALKTPARFGIHLYFPYPKFNERKIYIERELKKLACYMPQFDVDKLVRLTEGCSYEKIKLMLNDALFSAKVFGKVLTQKSLENSLEKIIYGISAEDCKLDDKQKNIVATHLAGEMLITQLLGADIKIAKATIRNVSAKIEEQPVFAQFYGEDTKQNPVEFGKIFFCHDHDMVSIVTNEDKQKQCMIQLAGQLAEIIRLGVNSDYHPKDKQRAYDLTCQIIANGLDLKTLPKNLQKDIFVQAYQLLNECSVTAKNTLEQNRDKLDAIVKTLIEKQTIDSSDLDAIFVQQQAAAAA